MTFFIQTINDIAYTQVMEYLIEKSLTHTKDVENGKIILEIIGSSQDFKNLSTMIDDINRKREFPVIAINESF